MDDDGLDTIDPPNCAACLTRLVIIELGHDRVVWKCPSCGLMRL